MTDDSPAVRALRGRARQELLDGVDEGKVAYDLVHDARLAGLGEDVPREIIEQLRAEGLVRRNTRRVRIADIKADPGYRQPVSSRVVRSSTGGSPAQRARAQRIALTSSITVNERDGELFIVDGWTRLCVLAELGVEEVDVEVEYMTREQEIAEFIARNSKARR